MVDVAHDGDDRRPRHAARPRRRRRRTGLLRRRIRRRGAPCGPIPRRSAAAVSASITSVDLRHVALLHQQLDHVDRALGHAVGELLDGDRLRNGDLAHELLLRLVGAWPLSRCDAAAERGDRALALLVGAERGHEREPAGVFARRPRAGLAPAPDAPRRRRAAVAAASSSSASTAGGRGSAALGVASPNRFFDLLGLALGLGSCLRRFSSSRLRASARPRARALAPSRSRDQRFLFGDLALFGLAQPRRRRARARGALALPRSACAARRRTAWRLGGLRPPAAAPGPRRRPCRRAPAWRRRRAGPARRPWPRLACGFCLLDHDRLGAAVAEALAHDALLDAAPLRVSVLPGDAQLLFASLFRRFSHSDPNSGFAALFRIPGRRPSRPATGRIPTAAARKRRGAQRARKRLAFGAGKQGCMYHI